MLELHTGDRFPDEPDEMTPFPETFPYTRVSKKFPKMTNFVRFVRRCTL